MSNTHESALCYQALTRYLSEKKYAFLCPSPETQGRVVQKRSADVSTADAKNVQDFFGWSLACSEKTLRSILTDALFDRLHEASIITSADGDKFRSTIRVSNFYLPEVPRRVTNTSSLYYIHSSFPASPDSVFFGPDTYLFVSFLQTVTRHIHQPPTSIVDVCCGSGAGAIHMARTYPQAKAIGLDLNSHALRLGAVNAQLAGTTVDFHESNLFAAVPASLKASGIDLIVSNPPYIASSPSGEDLPIYADGGAEFGLDISLRIVEEGLRILSSNGVIVVYTGVAIPIADPSHDAFLERLQKLTYVELVDYTILHPDMWSEEIGRGAYADVGRIQVVGAILRRVSLST